MGTFSPPNGKGDHNRAPILKQGPVDVQIGLACFSFLSTSMSRACPSAKDPQPPYYGVLNPVFTGVDWEIRNPHQPVIAVCQRLGKVQGITLKDRHALVSCKFLYNGQLLPPLVPM